MIKLPIQDLILLTYLTNYDIRVIYECLESSNTRNDVFKKCSLKKETTEKEMTKAISDTKIAIDKLEYHKIKPIPFYEEEYPSLLKGNKDAPPIIYVKGELTKKKMAAVVGSREISKYADKITREIVGWLNEFEFGIVSGLAVGIDTFAHKYACLNKQYTISVLSTSLDVIYPKENYYLANEILDNGGCIISETIFNINRGKRSFVQRNRIQSALSEVVIPIEMGLNSGTMHTINFAERYNKKIMVMQPTKMLSELKQYAGIKEILYKKKNKIISFNNKKSFEEALILNKEDSSSQTILKL